MIFINIIGRAIRVLSVPPSRIIKNIPMKGIKYLRFEVFIIGLLGLKSFEPFPLSDFRLPQGSLIGIYS